MKKEKKFKEGRRVRSLSAMSTFIPFVMKTRNDACNNISDTIDVGNAERYIAEKRAEGFKSFGLMHLFIAAYVRAVAEKPGVNRFIRGQRVMARNDIEVMLTIKKTMMLNSDDTVVKIFPEPTDTAVEVYKKLDDIITENKADTESDFDKTAASFKKLPRFVFRFTIRMLFFLDYYGLLPRSLTKVSPFHGSLFVTSMGSLGIPPIYHHLYNFGNVPVFLSFGTRRNENIINDAGDVEQHKFVDIKIVTDERICDGFYFASVFKTIKHYMQNPEKLDIPPVRVVPDID